MKTNPIRAPRNYYRGRDPRKRAKTDRFNQVVTRVETYLNDEIAKLPDDAIHVFFSHEISSALHEDSDVVHRIVFGIDGDSNGVTIWKGDYDRDWQKRANPPISGAA